MTLQITISTINDTDFDGDAISFKAAEVLLDEENKYIGGSYDAGTSDADIKSDIRTKLTNLGYTWDDEI